ncbi:hypothetical protein Trydic_g13770 [Trypoxylus dichotomus]
MAQPGSSHNQEKAIKEAGTAKLGNNQKQHRAVSEASKPQPGPSQKQKQAISEAPEAQSTAQAQMTNHAVNAQKPLPTMKTKFMMSC